MAHDTFMQFVFEVQQFLAFALHHLLHWDACPTRHDFSDVLIGDLFVDQRVVALHSVEVGLGFFDGVLGVADLAVTQLSHTPIVAVAFRHGRLVLVLFDVVFLLLDDLHKMALLFPFSLDVSLLGIKLVEFMS